MDSRFEKAASSDKHGGTIVLELHNLKGIAAASASIRGVITRDGKEIKGSKPQTTAPQQSSGRTKMISFVDNPLILTLPAGPTEPGTKIYLSITDSREKCIGAMAFGVKDVKAGQIVGWYQLLDEIDGKSQCVNVAESATQEKKANDDDEDEISSDLKRKPVPKSFDDDDSIILEEDRFGKKNVAKNVKGSELDSNEGKAPAPGM